MFREIFQFLVTLSKQNKTKKYNKMHLALRTFSAVLDMVIVQMGKRIKSGDTVRKKREKGKILGFR